MSSFDKRRKPFISKYSKQVYNELRRYGASVALQIENGTAPVTFLMEVQFLSRGQMNNVLRDAWATTGAYFANYSRRQLQRIGISKPPELDWGQGLDDYWSKHGATKIKTIIDTEQDNIRKVIKDTIEEGQKEGLGVKEISKNVSKNLKGKEHLLRKKFDAMRITRTEVNAASNHADYEQGKLVGDRLLKKWVAVGIGTRPSHLDLHAQPPIPYDQKFYVSSMSGSPMEKPGDLAGGPGEVINCRCHIEKISKG